MFSTPYFSFALEVFRKDLASVGLEKIDREEKCEMHVAQVQTCLGYFRFDLATRVLLYGHGSLKKTWAYSVTGMNFLLSILETQFQTWPVYDLQDKSNSQTNDIACFAWKFLEGAIFTVKG